jgi:hypothetical protein
VEARIADGEARKFPASTEEPWLLESVLHRTLWDITCWRCYNTP